MFTKQRKASGKAYWGFLIGVVSLAFLSMNGFAAEMKGGKKAEEHTGSQQQERIDLQEGLRAGQIIDQMVKNGQDEQLGEVDDLIMSRNGKIKRVILSVGGFLGIGDRLVSTPFTSLQIREKGDIVYNATKQQLEKHPVFAYKREGFDAYYYSPPPPYGSFALAPPGYQGYFPYGHAYGSFPKGKYKGEYGSWGWEYYPDRLKVSGILNRAVFDEGGQQVGEIDDLIIGRNGKVATLILSVGRGTSLEFYDKLVVLPFKPLKVNGAGIVYEVTPQQLKELPGFHYEKK